MFIEYYSKDNIIEKFETVDVHCYHCKKLCAMSNTKELEGIRLCYNCYDKIMGYSWIDELPHKKVGIEEVKQP